MGSLGGLPEYIVKAPLNWKNKLLLTWKLKVISAEEETICSNMPLYSLLSNIILSTWYHQYNCCEISQFSISDLRWSCLCSYIYFWWKQIQDQSQTLFACKLTLLLIFTGTSNNYLHAEIDAWIFKFQKLRRQYKAIKGHL